MEMDRSRAEECSRKGAIGEEEVFLLHSVDVVVEQELIGSG